MTKENTLSAQEQIEYLATKVMGWELHKVESITTLGISGFDHVWYPVHIRQAEFNPLTDWNHWRQVEEKVMEDEKVWDAYCDKLIGNLTVAGDVFRLPLSKRVSALIAAHKELSPQHQ